MLYAHDSFTKSTPHFLATRARKLKRRGNLILRMRTIMARAREICLTTHEHKIGGTSHFSEMKGDVGMADKK